MPCGTLNQTGKGFQNGPFGIRNGRSLPGAFMRPTLRMPAQGLRKSCDYVYGKDSGKPGRDGWAPIKAIADIRQFEIVLPTPLGLGFGLAGISGRRRLPEISSVVQYARGNMNNLVVA